MTLFVNNPELLEKFRNGDPEALEAVYRHYKNFISTVVSRGIVAKGNSQVLGLREHADRMDIIQETFVRAFSKTARMAYDGVREYRPYLLAICKNFIINWSIKHHREIPIEESEMEANYAREENAPTFSIPYADTRVIEIVEKFIASLPEELAAIHHQRYVLGVSQHQAAAALRISRQRVRTLEKKLQKGLRRALTVRK